MPALRPQALGSSPPQVHAATRPRPEGKRRIHRPLCRIHHRALHRAGDERAWWKQAGIDPVKVARKLWRRTRLNLSERLDRPDTRVQGTDPERTLKPNTASNPSV